MLPFPHIDPVAVEIFGLPIRWYGLAYIAGFILGFEYLKHSVRKSWNKLTIAQLDSLFLYVIAGVIIGGRLGFALLYHPSHYFANPMDIIKTWEGGMSFHGGLIGVALSMLFFAWRQKLPAAHVADSIATAFPIGLFFGRLANFINAELWGRPTDMPWAMIFPTDALGLPRHPSQLYEAALEGILLFVVMHIVFSRRPYRPWQLSGLFLMGYGLSRFTVEFFRQPDAGFDTGIHAMITQGQMLCIPMILAGTFLLFMKQKCIK